AGGGLSVPKPTTNYKILRRRIYTMKTLSKRIMTACLALTMALAAAAPAMAAEPRVISSPVGHIVRLDACGVFAGPALRANGNYNQAKVDSASYGYGLNQKWRIAGSGNDGQIYTMQDGSGTTFAVNLYRTAVSPGVYPVTIAPVTGNLDDTTIHFSNYDGKTCRMWLAQGSYAGYRLYNDKSDSTATQSEVYFYNSDNDPNSIWYWATVNV
ncbi:MAG: hypothetical protein ACI3YT_06550, partial [Prevotella sp.]